jgi:hypothetical protein
MSSPALRARGALAMGELAHRLVAAPIAGGDGPKSLEATPVTAKARRSTARTAVMIATAGGWRRRKGAGAGYGPSVQIGSSPLWPGAQFGAGGLAVEHEGEFVDHGVLRCSRFRRTNPWMSSAPNSGNLPIE